MRTTAMVSGRACSWWFAAVWAMAPLAFTACLGSLAVPSAVAAEEPKASQAAEALSPSTVVEQFRDALSASKVDEAAKVLANVEGKTQLVQLLKMRVPRELSQFRVLAEKQTERLAVVVIGNEGPGFAKGIDIDPMLCIRETDGWRMLPYPRGFRDLGTQHAADQELLKQGRQLQEWFDSQRAKILADRTRQESN